MEVSSLQIRSKAILQHLQHVESKKGIEIHTRFANNKGKTDSLLRVPQIHSKTMIPSLRPQQGKKYTALLLNSCKTSGNIVNDEQKYFKEKTSGTR